VQGNQLKIVANKLCYVCSFIARPYGRLPIMTKVRFISPLHLQFIFLFR